MPKRLVGREKFEWKLNQLNYAGALSGKKKWGRQRKNIPTLAREADAFEGDFGQALRDRAERHSNLEDLANGGFETRPFDSLKKELEDAEKYVDNWTDHSENLVTERFISEMATTPAAILSEWDTFVDRIQFWPGPEKAPMKWLPTDPKNRVRQVPLTTKVEFFVKTFNDKVAKPLCRLKESSADGVLEVMKRMHDTISNAATMTVADKTMDEMLDKALSRCKGVVALLSRKFGDLGSSKEDATLLVKESEDGTSGLYSAIVSNPDMKELVQEYWTTIEASTTEWPGLRKLVSSVKLIRAASSESFASLQNAFVRYSSLTPTMRPTQTDELKVMLVVKSEMFAAYVVGHADTEAWLCQESVALRDLLTRAAALGHVPSAELANNQLRKLDLAGVSELAAKKLTNKCVEFVTYIQVSEPPSILDIANEYIVDVKRTGLDDAEVEVESATGIAVVRCLNEITDLMTAATKPNSDDGVCLTNVLKLNHLYNYCKSLAMVLPIASSVPLIENFGLLPTIADHCSAVLEYLELGSDMVSRSQRDPDLEQAKKLSHAVACLKDILERFPGKPGFFSMLHEECQQVQTDAQKYVTETTIGVLVSRTRTLTPMATIKPFVDKASPHWFAEFDGDLEQNTEVIDFLQQTLFTTVPDRMQAALDAARAAKQHVEDVCVVFGVAAPKAVQDARITIHTAEVTDFEGQCLGTLCELAATPISLKRELCDKYATCLAAIWRDMHPNICALVERFIPPSLKKAKVGA